MRVFVTKYALTLGIKEMVSHGAVITSGPDKMAYGKLYDVNAWGNQRYSGKDVWFTLEEAKIDAENRRLKVVERLKKQIIKMEKLTIKITENDTNTQSGEDA